MKKYFIVLTVMIFIFACNSQKKIALKYQDKPKTEVFVGDTIQIALKENPSTGFKWTWEILEGEKLVEFLSAQYQKTDSLIGSAGTKIFSFLAKKKGIFVVKFDYKRFNRQTAKTDTFVYEIKERK